MARPKINIKIPRKPRLDENSRFFIDYEWWNESNMSLESYLQSQLGYEISLGEDDGNAVDLIDSETGEVRQLSGFEFAIQNYFNNQDSAETQSGSLVNNVFTTLLGNGNRPMTATEIASAVNRPPETIIRTLGSGKVYLGIRPYLS